MAELRQRPRHTKVLALFQEIVTQGLGVASTDIEYERDVPRIRGRIDALLGNVVVEAKSDLRSEAGDVAAKLPGYIAEAQRQTGRRFLGIATDGATWEAHELRDGALILLDRFEPQADRPEALIGWLEPLIAALPDLIPDAPTIARHLGAGSVAWARARRDLETLWAGLHDQPEVALKRKLWADLLGQAQGSEEGGQAADALFLQHTYLTVVAKTIAAHVLEVAPADADSVLSGQALREMGIAGAVESDLFDWVLKAGEAGADFVMRLMRHTARLRLRAVGDDVMKRIYESLIPRDERYRLGEYYTPDWLAGRVVRAAVPDPLRMRVLDPACGSGTFLFHAIRHFLSAAAEAGWPAERAVAACITQVRGMDIHPVAVILARVTWLLAIGVERLRARPRTFSVPVFMGDALQRSVRPLAGMTDLTVEVPDEARHLHIPGGLAEDQARFDVTIDEMTRMVEEGATERAFDAWLGRQGTPGGERRMLCETFVRLKRLHAAGRNRVWGFVLRNLARPLWLSRPEERVDALVGNPPWLPFRGMAPAAKREMKAMSAARDLWVGGKLATQQDLSGLFLVRAAELYLKPGGRLAMVMPYAVLNRPAYEGVRRGTCGGAVTLRITGAWAMRNEVKPLFPTASCVLFAERAPPRGLPAAVTAMAGLLSVRDAHEAEAAATIKERREPWPKAPGFAESHYRKRFVQGATIAPRRFWMIERRDVGPLGASAAEPLVRGRAGSLDKEPWNAVAPPEGRIEREFIRPIFLGEGVAPFRALSPLEEIIPVLPCGTRTVDAQQALNAGFPRLGAWLQRCEVLWRDTPRKAQSGARVALTAHLDHFGKLSAQLTPRNLRVVYAKSGKQFAAGIVREANAIISERLYWHAPRSEAEAYYLLAILNADTLRRRIAGMQSQGEGGARDFDKLAFEQPIPAFDRRDALHAALADAARRAEALAATVPLAPGAHFQVHRKAIRATLTESGLAAEIDALVERLLPELG